METILKHHNQIELPQEVCRKLELLPGIRLVIEIEKETGAIILHPMTKKMRKIRLKQHSSSTQPERIR